MLKSILTILLLIFPLCTLKAQQTSIAIGTRVEIQSAILNETRVLLTYKPAAELASGQKKYPILFVLDGEANFLKTVGLVDHLSSSGRIPGLIVVGVTNTLRNGRPSRMTDLAPALQQENAIDPAAKFLEFLAEEALPYVDELYPTQPYRILAGHSLGGLFSVFSLFAKPETFNAIIAVSPSLGRNNQQEVTRAGQYFEQDGQLTNTLHLSVANEGGNTLIGTRALVDLLTQKAPATFSWHFDQFEAEDHISVFLPALENSLESIFKGWRISENLLTDHDVSVAERHYQKLSNRLGFPVPVPEFLYTTLGYRILAEQDFSYAQWTFNRQLEAYPGSAAAYVGLGDVMLMQGELDQAKDQYKKALEINPGQERVRHMLSALN